jgi:hypothetical protein
MTLLIHVDGASDRDRLTGAAAAWAVFDQAGVTASSCAWAVFQRDQAAARDRPTGQGPGEQLPSVETLRRAAIWDLAQDAGVRACCTAMTGVPDGSYMELPQSDFLAGM